MTLPLLQGLNFGAAKQAQQAGSFPGAELSILSPEFPGIPIDELRANCEAETGLPAPIQPVWSKEEKATAKAAE